MDRHRHHALGFGKEVQYEILGEPVDSGGAELLAKQDPYQFQWWALGLVGACPAEQKKGADQGIDGRLYFHDEHLGSGKTKQIIFSVKAGHITPVHVRELRGVAEREQAQIGVLISLEEPTKPMRSEAAKAGFYEPPTGAGGQKYARLQLLTVEDLLNGKEVAYPHVRANVTFKKAPKAQAKAPEQLLLAAEETASYGDSDE